MDQVPWLLGVCGMKSSGGCQESNLGSPWDENSWWIVGCKLQMLVIFLPVFMAPVGCTGDTDIWSGPVLLFTWFYSTIPIACLRLFIPFECLLNHGVALPFPFKKLLPLFRCHFCPPLHKPTYGSLGLRRSYILHISGGCCGISFISAF